MGVVNYTPADWATTEIPASTKMDTEIKDPWTAIQAAWTSYTPSTSNITLGTGGTAVGAYHRIGKTIMFRAKVTLGTSGALTGNPSISLPIAPASGAVPHFQAIYADGGTVWYDGMSLSVSGSTLNSFGTHTSASNFFVAVSATVPFTWASTDYIYVFGTYETT